MILTNPAAPGRLTVLGIGVALMLGTAAAQNVDPRPLDTSTMKKTVAHYVRVVPNTPAEYEPITAKERLGWFTRATIGPKSLTGGLFSAGFGTAINSPSEYGPHWEGFAKRYAIRLTGVSTSSAMEASLGAAWGEDPRYFHTEHQRLSARVKNVLDLTFRAYGSDGERHPAYARYMAITGSNFLSNTWRVQSQADWQHALRRTGEGFGARALSNAFGEFVTFVWTKSHHSSSPPNPGTNP
ncbi:MAG TPA: hypothetical protein VKB58_08440 [Terriglobales bacterium]|nr:hypothetical protein [Terriglobales bacterium]